jgi:radical SAM protein with 4Fe4S-binding SPASM domain
MHEDREHLLVCPPDAGLLSRIKGREIVIDASAEGLGVCSLMKSEVGRHNHLHCLYYAAPSQPLDAVEFPGEMTDLPSLVLVGGIGSFTSLMRRVQHLRSMNLRLFLPPGREEHFTMLKILASLGIGCGVWLDGADDAPWVLLEELCAYALCNRIPVAPIEPFDYAQKQYRHGAVLSLKTVFFDNPQRFLHVDCEGNVAMSKRDLSEKRYIGAINDLRAAAESDALRDAHLSRQREFIACSACSMCPAWRVCGGEFVRMCRAGKQGRDFFTGLMDAVEVKRKTDSLFRGGASWRW